MEKINTPFTNEEVENLNEYQLAGRFHPFTCANDGDELHIMYEFRKEHPTGNYEDYIKNEKEKGIPFPEMAFNSTSLIATNNGWICPVCDYKQNWAHDFMAKKQNNDTK